MSVNTYMPYAQLFPCCQKIYILDPEAEERSLLLLSCNFRYVRELGSCIGCVVPSRHLPPSTSRLPPEWYWKVLLRHWVYRVCAVILFLFSLIIVWSEATFGIPNVRLSIIANIIYLGHNNTNYIVIEVGVCTVPSSHAPHPTPHTEGSYMSDL